MKKIVSKTILPCAKRILFGKNKDLPSSKKMATEIVKILNRIFEKPITAKEQQTIYNIIEGQGDQEALIDQLKKKPVKNGAIFHEEIFKKWIQIAKKWVKKEPKRLSLATLKQKQEKEKTTFLLLGKKLQLLTETHVTKNH